MQNLSNRSSDPLFVVVLREFLVARDIEMIIRGMAAEARIILARTLDEAIAAMPQGRIRAAFVQIDPQDFARSSLGQRVETDGGRPVLVGVEPGDRVPKGWAELPFPFAESDVAALLALDGCCAR
ncbi:MAG: hypothetical protein EAZ40_14970 [Rhodobacterales bacterium]|nr:MAG: hypothetical protein EAZ40_14970 [Rhodobacterales bacterium]